MILIFNHFYIVFRFFNYKRYLLKFQTRLLSFKNLFAKQQLIYLRLTLNFDSEF
jgi:hypothetical protein